jgi:pyruvate dehydrogenase E2 component (dihydrolipoamide acetyltransferase)
MFDIDGFTAIINPPEAGILAVGKLAKQPVVIGDEIVIRMMMQLSLTYDHRTVDGAPAAQFLKRIKELLENPMLLI